jgi:hypothetical protein
MAAAEEGGDRHGMGHGCGPSFPGRELLSLGRSLEVLAPGARSGDRLADLDQDVAGVIQGAPLCRVEFPPAGALCAMAFAVAVPFAAFVADAVGMALFAIRAVDNELAAGGAAAGGDDRDCCGESGTVEARVHVTCYTYYTTTY